MEILLDKSINWLNANPNLSGWAQALGAIVAVLIAIWVPAFQRWQQLKDSRRIEIESDLVCASGVFLLMSDAESWLQGHQVTAEMQRADSRRDVVFHDLMDRIKLWEQREKDGNRVICLYTARHALLRTQTRLEYRFLQSKGMAPKELDFLATDIQQLKCEKDIARWLLDAAQLQKDWQFKNLRQWRTFRLRRINLLQTSAEVFIKRLSIQAKAPSQAVSL